jgi:hypothetical protein
MKDDEPKGLDMAQAEINERENNEKQSLRLSDAVRQVFQRQDVVTKFVDLKSHHSDFDEPEFLWNALVQSFSTLGNSSGYDRLIGNPENREKMEYAVMMTLPSAERKKYIEEVLRKANVRFPSKKAMWLQEDLNILAQLGGPEQAKAAFEREPGAASKMKFLERFYGIGKKYARNIPMDVYHPEFHSCIAVDARIKALSKHLGLRFPTYEAEEQFYLSVAERAGIEGWDLDRLLYHFEADVSTALNQPAQLAA